MDQLFQKIKSQRSGLYARQLVKEVRGDPKRIKRPRRMNILFCRIGNRMEQTWNKQIGATYTNLAFSIAGLCRLIAPIDLLVTPCFITFLLRTCAQVTSLSSGMAEQQGSRDTQLLFGKATAKVVIAEDSLMKCSEAFDINLFNLILRVLHFFMYTSYCGLLYKLHVATCG